MSARRARLAFGVLAVLSALGLGWLLWWSERPDVRYAALSCQRSIIYERDGAAALTLLGTSRVRFGVDERALADRLGLAGPERIANLARAGRGMEQLHAELLELDAARGIAGPIVVEYPPEDEVSFSKAPLYYQQRPDFGAVAPWRLVVADAEAKPREPAYSRVRDLLAAGQTRLGAALESAIVGVPRDRHNPESVRVDAEGCPSFLDEPSTTQRRRVLAGLRGLREAVGEGGSWRDLPRADHPVGLVNLDAQEHYVRRIIALGEARGVPVHVVLMPALFEAPPSDAFLRDFEARFGQPLEVPPDEVLDVLYAPDGSMYQDDVHVNAQGSGVVAAWLAEVVR